MNVPDFPAFPSQELDACGMPRASAEFGLSARDVVAIHVLAALLSTRHTNVDNLGYVFPSEKEPFCRAAYSFADAMLIARLRIKTDTTCEPEPHREPEIHTRFEP